MKLKTLRTWLVAVLATPMLASTSSAVLVIAGVTDGDLPNGIPKSIILQAAAPVADLSMWGVGSATNGGGTDGVELTFGPGMLDTGDVIVIAGNSDSFDFFNNNFVLNFTLIQNSLAVVNGDDAVEVFLNGVMFDTYGDIDSQTGTWTYADGFATRTGAGVGAFDQANYTTIAGAFDGMNEQQHIDTFVTAGFTQIPEPSSALFVLLGTVVCLRRRR